LASCAASRASARARSARFVALTSGLIVAHATTSLLTGSRMTNAFHVVSIGWPVLKYLKRHSIEQRPSRVPGIS